ncbi:hypothetical protein J6590_043756 [Homalodisca vitripennis]|nr:hypothetical protein J6590_043756 [Homalodisca vitripennis]
MAEGHDLREGSDLLEDKETTKQKTETTKKKSILLAPGTKRGSSKATIQWKDDDKSKLTTESGNEEGLQLHHLESRGARWKSLRELVLRLQAKTSHDLEEDRLRDLNFLRLLGLRGAARKHNVKGIELTTSQEVSLTLLRHRTKMDNSTYIKDHPELSILLELVYRQLVKKQPQQPTLFVAEYVHHLNLHREELELEEIDVPFDRPVVTSEIDEERQSVLDFVRELVERCAAIASRGTGYVTVIGVVESMLRKVCPSVESALEEPRKSAVVAASNILNSLLMTVVVARTRSAEIIADEVISSILENLLPSVSSAGEIYLEVREDVERFIRTLLKKITVKADRQISLRDNASVSVEEEEKDEHPDVTEKEGERAMPKPILKKNTTEESHHISLRGAKVKFM